MTSNHIERAIAQIARWVTSIQVERDGHAHMLSTPQMSPVTRQFAMARLAALDVLEEKAKTRLADLESKRHWPELILPRRPRHRMVKIRLRREPRKAKNA